VSSPTADIMEYQRRAFAALGFGDLKEARRLIDWADAAAVRSPDLPKAYRGAITGLRARIGRFEALAAAGKFKPTPFVPDSEGDEAQGWLDWEKDDKRRAASLAYRSAPRAYTGAQKRGAARSVRNKA